MVRGPVSVVVSTSMRSKGSKREIMFSHSKLCGEGGDLVVEDFDASAQAGDVFGQFDIVDFAGRLVGGVGSGSHGGFLVRG